MQVNVFELVATLKQIEVALTLIGAECSKIATAYGLGIDHGGRMNVVSLNRAKQANEEASIAVRDLVADLRADRMKLEDAGRLLMQAETRH